MIIVCKDCGYSPRAQTVGQANMMHDGRCPECDRGDGSVEGSPFREMLGPWHKDPNGQHPPPAPQALPGTAAPDQTPAPAVCPIAPPANPQGPSAAKPTSTTPHKAVAQPRRPWLGFGGLGGLLGP